jgi:hypothetical protein
MAKQKSIKNVKKRDGSTVMWKEEGQDQDNLFNVNDDQVLDFDNCDYNR